MDHFKNLLQTLTDTTQALETEADALHLMPTAAFEAAIVSAMHYLLDETKSDTERVNFALGALQSAYEKCRQSVNLEDYKKRGDIPF